MNREVVMQTLFALLQSGPLAVEFTADTTTGDVTLANVSDTTGLMVGMPVTGDGLAGDSQIATLTPEVTVTLPAIADRTASPMLQGFQTASRRLADPGAEQDLPSLYLVEIGEVHPERPSTGAMIVELHCEARIYTRAGADANAIPAAILNMLIDGVEKALVPGATEFRQNLGLAGVLYARIEGELQKDPGDTGLLATAIIPIKIAVRQDLDNYPL